MDDSKVALVTGAARGIGVEVARQLAHAKFDVIVTARDLDAADVASDELGSEGLRSRAIRLDIADPASIDELGRALDGERLDVLENNAAAFADWSELAIKPRV